MTRSPVAALVAVGAFLAACSGGTDTPPVNEDIGTVDFEDTLGPGPGPGGGDAVAGDTSADAGPTPDGVGSSDDAQTDAAAQGGDASAGDAGTDEDAEPTGDAGGAGAADATGLPPDAGDTYTPTGPIPSVGDLVITELMPDPSMLLDAEAEWIEIQNVTSEDLDLGACVLHDAGSDSVDLGSLPGGPHVIAAGARWLLGPNADPLVNGGVSLNLEYGSAMFLSNTGDEVMLTCAGELVDAVAYDGEAGWPLELGRAMALDGASAPDAALNDDPTAWCAAPTAYTVSNFGSPGDANPVCPVPDDVVDYCRLVAPLEALALVGAPVVVIGDVYDEGDTDENPWTDSVSGLVGAGGIGPQGVDPGDDPDGLWTWIAADGDLTWDDADGEAGHDRYEAVLEAPAVGTWAVAFRFSMDDGATWLLCDGDGSDDGYDPAAAGELTTVEDPCDPNPCLDPPPASCDGDIAGVPIAPGLCTMDGAAAACAYEQETEDCALLAGTCDGGACVDGAVAPTAGEVIFTEIMQNPAATGDADGEWVELYSLADHAVVLDGCTLSSAGNDSDISLAPELPLVMLPGDYLVFARNIDPAANGGVAAVYPLTGIALGNADDHITLTCAEEVDAVAWDGGPAFPDPSGASMQLDPAAYDSDLNDAAESWCVAAPPYGAGDLGTPGAPNLPCPGPDPCKDVVCEAPPAPACVDGAAVVHEAIGACAEGQCGYQVSSEQHCVEQGLLCVAGACVDDPCVPNPCTSPPAAVCDGDALLLTPAEVGTCALGDDGAPACAYADKALDCSIWGGTCVDGACDGIAVAPAPGQIVFAELMIDPEQVGDDEGEWIELLNVSATLLDLAGCTIRDNQDDDHLLDTAGPLLIAPGEVVLLGADPTPEINGGLTPDYTWGGKINLANAVDELVLECDAQAIDAVAWDAAAWPLVPGASIQLDEGSLDADANDAPTAWCRSFEFFGAGDLGTPGEVNPPCPAPNPVDFCRLDEPAWAEVLVGQPASFVGRLAEAGLTDVTTATDPHPLVLTELGFGPPGTDPVADAVLWSFVAGLPDMTWDGAASGDLDDDVYGATLTTQNQGVWDVALRVSVDGGLTWTACDRDSGEPGGDGSEDGYQSAQAGTLTVAASPCQPNPCVDPPDDTCEGDALTAHEAVGSCTILSADAAGCAYAVETIDCAALGGSCAGDACVGTASAPGPGEVVVTELLVDPDAASDGQAEWIELLNVSSEAVLLDGCVIGDVSGGDAHALTPTAPLLVPAGHHVVLARSGDVLKNGGVSADYVYGGAIDLANDADAVILTCLGEVVDAVTYDAATYPLAPGAAMQTDPGASTAAANDSPAAWCAAFLPFGAGDAGTPGVLNPACPTPKGVDWCRLQWPLSVEADVGDPLTAYLRVFELGVTDLSAVTDPHPLLAAQFGFGPDGSDPTVDDSEWTVSGATPNIGWEDTEEPGNDEYRADLITPAAGTWDFAFRVTVDGGLTWTWCDGEGALPGQDGSEDGYQVALAGDLVSTAGPCDPNPCLAPPPSTCASDTLTTHPVPGLCTEPAEPGGEVGCAFEPVEIDCAAAGGTCDAGACVGTAVTPLEGQLVFTEVMRDPSAVVDSKGEWIELHNPTDIKLDLQGCVLRDDDDDAHVIDPGAPWVVEAGAWVLLGRLSGAADSGGLPTPDYLYTGVSMANDDDELVLECGGSLIDHVDLEVAAFPLESGVAIQLSSDALDVDSNDGGEHWCPAATPYGEGDLGTPGAPNALCEAAVVPEPVDWCRLQWPETIEAPEGAPTVVFGRVYEVGVTDASPGTDVVPLLQAELAWGPVGSDPSEDDAGWSFLPASPNPDWDDAAEPDNDEYQASLAPPGVGAWDYAYRFSADGGLTWTWCDLATGVDGEDGSEDGYQPANAGSLTGVVPDPCADIDCATPTSGQLVIAEIMTTPTAVPAGTGQWLEVVNPTALTLALSGCELASDDDLGATVGPLAIGPGERVVLGASGESAFDGGAGVAWAWGAAISLDAGGDAVSLSCDGAVVDAVIWDQTFPSLAGASLSLAPEAADADANDQAASWCLAISTYGAGDLGTPGAANDPCPEVEAVDWCRLQWPSEIEAIEGATVDVYGTVDEDGITDATLQSDPHPWLWAEVGVGPAATDPAEPASGWTFAAASPNPVWVATAAPTHDEYFAALTVPPTGAWAYVFRVSADQGATWLYCDLDTGVAGSDGSADGLQLDNLGALTSTPAPPAGESEGVISEIMKDPAAVGDAAGEWIELTGVAAHAVDLEGCVLSDDVSDAHTIAHGAPLLLWPGQQLVLARSADPATNGGVTPDYAYSGMTLTNGTDQVALTCDGDTVDWVEYADATFPDVPGAALQLSADALDPATNDAGTVWCAATSAYGSGDLGTPGAPNDVCLP